MTQATYLVGDVFDRLKELADASVDLVVTSPPFLALRSYLPADHPDKAKEIGSEPTPAAFIDVMLALSAELRRVLAPHGSICVELGDTYAGSGGAGGDYLNAGLRDGQPAFEGSAKRGRAQDREYDGGASDRWDFAKPGTNSRLASGEGWPLAKSKTLIPELYRLALAYGINPLTGAQSPAGQWRIRNVVTWCRPNPPVGALGDKWRPATSDIVVACVSGKRYWDDIATRQEHKYPDAIRPNNRKQPERFGERETNDVIIQNSSGAPLLDYWEIPPGGYPGSHYAVYPPTLIVPLIKAMAPPKVCRECGEPVRRIVTQENASAERLALADHIKERREAKGLSQKEVAVHFPSASGGVTGCVWNWENAARVPTDEQWSLLVDLLDLSDEYAYLIEGTRQWTESLVEYNANGRPLSPSQRRTDYGRGGNPEEWGDSRIKATRHLPDAWSDCRHDNYRPALILDPFAGSGTTGVVATGHGHDCILIDLDERNADLARERIGDLFLTIEGAA